MSTRSTVPDGRYRLWPGVALVAIQVLVWVAAHELVSGDATPFVAASGIGGGLAVALWWLFASRAARPERWWIAALVGLVLALTWLLAHPSIRRGAMGFQFFIYALPVFSLVFVGWAAFLGRLPASKRWAALLVALGLASAGLSLTKSAGVTSDGAAMLRWRWTPTAEERLLAGAGSSATKSTTDSADRSERDAQTSADWPGLRGPNRDATIRHIRIETDWSRSPPMELWRRPIGPGWSSVAISGELLYTQEQRGEMELVSCYRASTGEPIWTHSDKARFWQSESGAGPLATPALAEGRVFTLGATGILNALDATSGSLLWSHNAAAQNEAELPHWGFSSSPLVVDDQVIVQTGRLVAYDAATGARKWSGPEHSGSHSSPQLINIAGTDQVVMLGSGSAFAFAPADGTLLWEHSLPGSSIAQPAALRDGILLGRINAAAQATGIRRLRITNHAPAWQVEERWTSNQLKTAFSDFVVHNGSVFGFDGRILTCLDLETGERRWKGGRYGSGQLLLFADQDLLLVLSEQGELALVSATPDGYQELARFPTLRGKSWSHPASAGHLLVVRNDEEMVALRLPG